MNGRYQPWGMDRGDGAGERVTEVGPTLTLLQWKSMASARRRVLFLESISPANANVMEIILQACASSRLYQMQTACGPSATRMAEVAQTSRGFS